MGGVTQGAGLSLRWYRDNFCTDEQHVAESMACDPYELMTQEAAQAEVGSKGLIYLPYLMGERTPHLDPYAKGIFFGLAPSLTKKEMIRSIMEGVTYSLRDCLTLIHELGIVTDKVRVSGGGSKSELWRQMQADIYNCPVTTIHASEGPALGVAILAGVGTGVFSSVEEACEGLISYGEGTQPNPANHERYMAFYKIYKKNSTIN